MKKFFGVFIMIVAITSWGVVWGMEEKKGEQPVKLLRTSLINLGEQFTSLSEKLGWIADPFLGPKLQALNAVHDVRLFDFPASEEKASGNGSYNIKAYDVKVLVQKLTGPLGERSKDKFGFELLRPGWGCGFHALKNMLLLCSMLEHKKVSDVPMLRLPSFFLHYFEAERQRVKSSASIKAKHAWPRIFFRSEQQKISWYRAWMAYRDDHKIPYAQGLDDPPTSSLELENIISGIKNKTVLAPLGSEHFIANTIVLDHFETEETKKRLKKVAALFKKESKVVIPIIISYKSAYSVDQELVEAGGDAYLTEEQRKKFDRTGWHWIAIVINKVGNSVECLLADAWRSGDESGQRWAQKNWQVLQQLLSEFTKG